MAIVNNYIVVFLIWQGPLGPFLLEPPGLAQRSPGANASLIHSIHTNTFTPFTRIVATKFRTLSDSFGVPGQNSKSSHELLPSMA